MSESAEERAHRIKKDCCRKGSHDNPGIPRICCSECVYNPVQELAAEFQAAEDAAREEELDFVESKLQLHLHDGSIRWHGVHNVAIKQALGVVARRRKAIRALAGEEGEG